MEELIIQDIENGSSFRSICRNYNISRGTLEHLIVKNNIKSRFATIEYNETFFNKVDTKECAYILGFLLGDSFLSEDSMQITIAIKDKVILDFIKNCLNCRIITSLRFNKDKRQFPSCSINIGNKVIIKDLHRLFGGFKKDDRHLPIISKELERYMLLGFFDAEGCITWGYRKDRGRLWQKVSFTSSLNMLTCVQNILLKNNISTVIRPKSQEKCFVLEFSNRKDVCNFYNVIYQDLVVLKRKNDNYQALRLELGELLGSSNELLAAEPTE